MASSDQPSLPVGELRFLNPSDLSLLPSVVYIQNNLFHVSSTIPLITTAISNLQEEKIFNNTERKNSVFVTASSQTVKKDIITKSMHAVNNGVGNIKDHFIKLCHKCKSTIVNFRKNNNLKKIFEVKEREPQIVNHLELRKEQKPDVKDSSTQDYDEFKTFTKGQKCKLIHKEKLGSGTKILKIKNSATQKSDTYVLRRPPVTQSSTNPYKTRKSVRRREDKQPKNRKSRTKPVNSIENKNLITVKAPSELCSAQRKINKGRNNHKLVCKPLLEANSSTSEYKHNMAPNSFQTSVEELKWVRQNRSKLLVCHLNKYNNSDENTTERDNRTNSLETIASSDDVLSKGSSLPNSKAKNVHLTLVPPEKILTSTGNRFYIISDNSFSIKKKHEAEYIAVNVLEKDSYESLESVASQINTVPENKKTLHFDQDSIGSSQKKPKLKPSRKHIKSSKGQTVVSSKSQESLSSSMEQEQSIRMKPNANDSGYSIRDSVDENDNDRMRSISDDDIMILDESRSTDPYFASYPPKNSGFLKKCDEEYCKRLGAKKPKEEIQRGYEEPKRGYGEMGTKSKDDNTSFPATTSNVSNIRDSYNKSLGVQADISENDMNEKLRPSRDHDSFSIISDDLINNSKNTRTIKTQKSQVPNNGKKTSGDSQRRIIKLATDSLTRLKSGSTMKPHERNPQNDDNVSKNGSVVSTKELKATRTPQKYDTKKNSQLTIIPESELNTHQYTKLPEKKKCDMGCNDFCPVCGNGVSSRKHKLVQANKRSILACMKKLKLKTGDNVAKVSTKHTNMTTGFMPNKDEFLTNFPVCTVKVVIVEEIANHSGGHIFRSLFHSYHAPEVRPMRVCNFMKCFASKKPTSPPVVVKKTIVDKKQRSRSLKL